MPALSEIDKLAEGKPANDNFKGAEIKKPADEISLIKSRIESVFYPLDMIGFDAKELNVCDRTIRNIVSRSFWNPDKSKIFSLTDNVLNQYSEKDAFKYLCKINGQVFDRQYALKALAENKISKTDTNTLIRACESHLIDYIKVYSQRSNIEMRVDMFADEPRIDMRDEIARIIFTHKPYQTLKKIDERVVADYKEHFPWLDKFLDFIVASRFARDRKKSYLWFLCPSDWGKGFLMALLNSLGISTELSVKEVESIFEGKPAGKSMVDFKRSIVLIFDEFKTVKSEIKQLQSEISLAPKNQLGFKVEIFSKLFFSAENVNSLIGEHGVEDQFLNRFSQFVLNETITKRPLFIEIGAAPYFDGVQPYIANYLNKAIAEKISDGKKNAEIDSESYLIHFMDEFGLHKTNTSISSGLNGIVAEIAEMVKKQWNPKDNGKFNIIRTDKGLYLKSPTKFIDRFIEENIAHSEQSTITKRRGEIIKMLSVDGKGIKAHRPDKDSNPINAILINEELTK